MASTDVSAHVDVDLTITPMCEFADADDGMHGKGEPATHRYRHTCPHCGDTDAGLIGELCIRWLQPRGWRHPLIECLMCGESSDFKYLLITKL